MSNNLIITESTANITVTQINTNTAELINTQTLICNQTNYLKVTINYTKSDNKFLQKANIKLRTLSINSNNFKICMLADEIGGIFNIGETISYGKTNTEIVDEEEVAYITFDVAEVVLNSESTIFNFIIMPSDNLYSMTIYGSTAPVKKPSISHYEIIFNPEVKNKPILTNNLGNFLSYETYLLYGYTRYNIPLINLNVGDVPIQLNLIYTENYPTNKIVDNWMFNYNQYIINYDEDTYHYIDGTGKKHIFKVTNQENIFHDKTNKKLFLKVEENKLIITDEKKLILEFDLTGRLIKIKNKKSDTTIKECNIYYNSDGKINKIEDDLYRICDFIYETNTVTIKYSNIREVKLNIVDNYIVSISGLVEDNTKLLTINNVTTLNDNTVIKNKYIDNIITPYGERLNIEYLGNGLVKSIRQLQNDTKLFEQRISRNGKQVIVYSYKYNLTESYNNDYIEFNDDGSIIKTFQEVDGQIINEKSTENIDYYRI